MKSTVLLSTALLASLTVAAFDSERFTPSSAHTCREASACSANDAFALMTESGSLALTGIDGSRRNVDIGGDRLMSAAINDRGDVVTLSIDPTATRQAITLHPNDSRSRLIYEEAYSIGAVSDPVISARGHVAFIKEPYALDGRDQRFMYFDGSTLLEQALPTGVRFSEPDLQILEDDKIGGTGWNGSEDFFLAYSLGSGFATIAKVR